MPRKAKELSALHVNRLTEAGLHFVGGVAGLAMQVQPSGARSWVLRLSVAGKRREMGLGGFPDVPLADARRRAREVREQADKGIDPIAARRATVSSLLAEQAKAITFKAAANSYVDAHEAGWRSAKHAKQWRSTLATTYPTMGEFLVRDISSAHVLKVLEPIWRTKSETASRLRGRIESVLDWSIARGYRDGPNPARWKGHLDKLLPSPRKVSRAGHHAAVPIDEMSDFMQRLRMQTGTGARALEFVILTAARSGEVRGATWQEINLDTGTWTVPEVRMKAGKEHRVPLPEAAIEILRKQPRVAETDLVFPAPRGGQLSDMTLVAVMRRMNVNAVPHGFRSTFRDWCSERTSYPREVAEMALAHAIGDKVEAAYRRGDLFEKRGQMMVAWANFLCGTLTPNAVDGFAVG